MLFAVDAHLQRRLAFEVLDHSPTQIDIRRFFTRVAAMLSSRGLAVAGVTTDGSPLYPDVIHEVFPQARHQIRRFHVIKEINAAVLRALSKLRKELDRQVPQLPRGRPATPEQKALARRAKRLRQRIGDLFDNRHLWVRRDLTPAQRRTLNRLARRHPDLLPLRRLVEEVYALFDRRCRLDTARTKLAKLRNRLTRFKSLTKTLSKLNSPTLEKALTFLDDRLLASTSNAVERANRRHRKMQKSICRVRTHRSLCGRIALDFFRERGLPHRMVPVAALHAFRSSEQGGLCEARQ